MLIKIVRVFLRFLVVDIPCLVLFVLSFPFSFIWRKTTGKRHWDTSWEYGRELIYAQGISYWKELLLDFRLSLEGKSVLEVGSGNGQWLIACDELGADKVVGVEPNDAVREYSLDRLKEYGKADRIAVHNASAELLPFEDESFDCLLCMGVFMFTQQKKALQEFSRVLRPGGQLLFTVNGLGYFLMNIKRGVLFSQFNEVRYGLVGFFYTLLKWIFGFQYSTTAVNVAEMKKMLETYGFNLERVWLHLNLEFYPMEHFGFPTNYAFRAVKNK